jgi:hypothetical protein
MVAWILLATALSRNPPQPKGKSRLDDGGPGRSRSGTDVRSYAARLLGSRCCAGLDHPQRSRSQSPNPVPWHM